MRIGGTHNDDCARLLLCSWVTPLVLRGDTVTRPKFQGVAREKLALSDKAVLEYSPSCHHPVSKSDILNVQKTVLERLQALEQKQVQGTSAPARVVHDVESDDVGKLRKMRAVLAARMHRPLNGIKKR